MINEETPIKPATFAPSEPLVHSSVGLASLVEHWNGIAARQREYGQLFPPRDRLAYTCVARAFETCANQLNQEIKKLANAELRHSAGSAASQTQKPNNEH